MKILIVEDEPKVASFIKKGLEENNYEAEIAYDGISAEKLVKLNRYDLFILDIIIPGINGLELCKKLKNLNSNIPVLMLTAPVSYTHLRAHETRHDLVCRLL